MKSYKERCLEAGITTDDTATATDIVYKWLMKGVEIESTKKNTIKEAIRNGVRHHIEEFRCEARRVKCSKEYIPVTTPAAKDPATTNWIIDGICKYNFFMRHKVNNKSLGDCTVEDVLWASDHHEKMSIGNKRRSKYYTWLSKNMSDKKKTVSQQIKENVAEEAYNRFLRGEKIAF